MTNIRKAAWAGAKFNGDFICIQTYSGYRSSTADPLGSQLLLSPNAGDNELGAAVIECLDYSRFVSPIDQPDVDLMLFDPDLINIRYSEWVSKLMAIYGYRNRRRLFKNMKSCTIESCNDLITIEPSHHDKLESWSGDGFSKTDFIVIPLHSDPESIGNALRIAFARCT